LNTHLPRDATEVQTESERLNGIAGYGASMDQMIAANVVREAVVRHAMTTA
jgi:hypothetical protein